MRPMRVQLSRAKGWRLPENTVKVDRSTKWGNPFIIGKDGTQDECIRKYRALMTGGPLPTPAITAERKGYRAMVLLDIGELRGSNLACWCKAGTSCHADLLLEMANR